MLHYANSLCVGYAERQSQKRGIKHTLYYPPPLLVLDIWRCCLVHAVVLLEPARDRDSMGRAHTRDAHIWKLLVTKSRSSAHHTWLWSRYLSGTPPPQRRTNKNLHQTTRKDSLHIHHVTRPHKLTIRGRVPLYVGASLFKVPSDYSFVVLIR
jgi:hypothetical protein